MRYTISKMIFVLHDARTQRLIPRLCMNGLRITGLQMIGLRMMGLGVILLSTACQPFFLPSAELTSDTLAVVINENDPHSVKAAVAYIAAHKIPARNVVRVSLPIKDTLSGFEYQRFQESLLMQLPAGINGLALVWRKPFRVECMSITSAIAFGGDRTACAQGCKTTRVNKWYFDPDGSREATRAQLRSMLVTGGEWEATLGLIQRGAQAQGNQPDGKALLVVSGDRNRDVRLPSFARLVFEPPGRVTIERRKGFVNSAEDVVFTSPVLCECPHLEAVRFLPGAVADHLHRVVAICMVMGR